MTINHFVGRGELVPSCMVVRVVAGNGVASAPFEVCEPAKCAELTPGSTTYFVNWGLVQGGCGGELSLAPPSGNGSGCSTTAAPFDVSVFLFIAVALRAHRSLRVLRLR